MLKADLVIQAGFSVSYSDFDFSAKDIALQVEGAFGVLKQDRDFRRFLTRGKQKTETQFFLLAFAFNIKKLWNRTLDGRLGLELFKKEVA